MKRNIVIFEEFDKCDCCGNIPETLHKNEGKILCEVCAKKWIEELNEEWNEIFDKIEKGEIETLPGEKRLHEINLTILDLEFEY